MQADAEGEAGASESKPFWKCKSVKILGAEARPLFAQQGQSALQIKQDGKVRTPSDHMGIVAELVYTNRNIQ